MGNVCYKRNKPTKKITVDRLSEYIKMKKPLIYQLANI